MIPTRRSTTYGFCISTPAMHHFPGIFSSKKGDAFCHLENPHLSHIDYRLWIICMWVFRQKLVSKRINGRCRSDIRYQKQPTIENKSFLLFSGLWKTIRRLDFKINAFLTKGIYFSAIYYYGSSFYTNLIGYSKHYFLSYLFGIYCIKTILCEIQTFRTV